MRGKRRILFAVVAAVEVKPATMVVDKANNAVVVDKKLILYQPERSFSVY
jgi:hypothetical protein